MYQGSEELYDALYRAAGKDYAAEAARVAEIVRGRRGEEGGALLDVACGTGEHLLHLGDHFDVEGLDLNERFLEIARAKLPEISLHRGDMRDFDLGRRFDVVTCLFSAIGCVADVEDLRRALGSMARHLAPEGVLLVEPWLTPSEYREGTIHALLVDEPDRKIVRMNRSERDGRLSILNFHYMTATSAEGIHTFTERHELALFERAEVVKALEVAGLEASYDEEGLMGRGLHIARRP